MPHQRIVDWLRVACVDDERLRPGIGGRIAEGLHRQLQHDLVARRAGLVDLRLQVFAIGREGKAHFAGERLDCLAVSSALRPMPPRMIAILGASDIWMLAEVVRA